MLSPAREEHRTSAKTDRNVEIVKRWAAGASYVAIAREFGISAPRVGQIVWRYRCAKKGEVIWDRYTT